MKRLAIVAMAVAVVACAASAVAAEPVPGVRRLLGGLSASERPGPVYDSNA